MDAPNSGNSFVKLSPTLTGGTYCVCSLCNQQIVTGWNGSCYLNLEHVFAVVVFLNDHAVQQQYSLITSLF